ncbi:MAG TPA: hypothetical protein VK254_00475 [Candidatus Bathyarchaeia archaeon]|nr:hypothetical protein [Candidatus Bathyarchaeia archaeon]
MRYLSKLVSVAKYMASSGYLIRKLHLTDEVAIGSRQSKKYKPSKRGKKLIALAEKVEIEKIIRRSDPLFFQVSRLYFNNLHEGLSRYAKEFSYGEFEKILTNADYIKLIAFNCRKHPVGVLIMTKNSKLLSSDIWLDWKYIEDCITSKEKMKKYWVSQSFVDKKERNGKIFSSLIVKAIQFCEKENAMVFFDWAVENTPYLPMLVKSLGNEIGIKLEGRNISCEVCSVYWPKNK